MTSMIKDLFGDSSETQIVLWLKNGAQLFAKAPFKLTFMLVGLLIVEGLLQLVPGTVSVVLSKFIVIFLGAGMWIIIDMFAKTNKLTFKGFNRYNNWIKILLITPVFMLPFVSQIAVAWYMLGKSGVDLLVLGTYTAVPSNTLGIIFAAGAPASIICLFVVPLILIKNASIKQAFVNNFHMLAMGWKSILSIFILNALILFLAPATFALSALLLGPLLLCIHYVAFQHLSANLDA